MKSVDKQIYLFAIILYTISAIHYRNNYPEIFDTKK